MSNPPVQTLRFRGPQPEQTQQTSKKSKKPARHSGILQDQTRRSARPPWSPSFSFALRMLLLVRIIGAMFSNIDDCDEVFNFWEPLHFLQRGYGFQTWELSPQFSIRSWAYILLHLPAAHVGFSLSGGQKRAAFFAVRMFLALLSSLSEVFLYRSVHQKVNERVGRYLFFMLLFNAGMWNASSAFLPSSLALYTTSVAFGASIGPVSLKSSRPTLVSTLMFATGAIVGWPFALAVAIPFVAEELFVYGDDVVPSNSRASWLLARWKRLFSVGGFASLLFIPVVSIDSLAYGKVTVVPWNIVSYNLFSSAHGPNLYGTAPWPFYFLNLILNFNVLFPLALGSLPALLLTSLYDPKRLGYVPRSGERSSPFVILALKLAPFYVWFYILTIQPHKEERFMFPAYSLLCFNAAVTVYLIRGWMETTFIKLTKSPYQASRSSIFSTFTFSVVTCSAMLSISRIGANWYYYHSPLSIAYSFEMKEIPFILNTTGLLAGPPSVPGRTANWGDFALDLSPIKSYNLTLCVGKEWYRFPGHYLIPEGVRVDFVKSEFDGMLPSHFQHENETVVDKWWPRPSMRYAPEGLNNLNKENPSTYVPVSKCHYLVDLDFPSNPSLSALEPRYAVDTENWERAFCKPFLDAQHSPLFGRTLWIPGQRWNQQNSWGDYCLLRNKKFGRKLQEMRTITQQDGIQPEAHMAQFFSLT